MRSLRGAGTACVLVALCAALLCAPLSRASESVSFSVLTLNVWDSLSHTSDGVAKVAGLVKRLGVDIAAFQEIDGATLSAIGNSLGPEWHVSSEGEFVSKFPVEHVYSYTNGRNSPAKAARLKLSDSISIKFANAHFYADPRATKMLASGVAKDEVQRVVEQSQQNSGIYPALSDLILAGSNDPQLPVVFVGDFNQPSEQDHNAVVGDSAYESQRRAPVVSGMRWPISHELLANGFTDAFRHIHSSVQAEPGFTWPADSSNKALRDRIDYIWTKDGSENGATYAFSVSSCDVVGPEHGDASFSEDMSLLQLDDAAEGVTNPGAHTFRGATQVDNMVTPEIVDDVPRRTSSSSGEAVVKFVKPMTMSHSSHAASQSQSQPQQHSSSQRLVPLSQAPQARVPSTNVGTTLLKALGLQHIAHKLQSSISGSDGSSGWPTDHLGIQAHLTISKH